MLHRIRLAMPGAGSGTEMSGQIEMDETLSGGKARITQKAHRTTKISGTGGMGNLAVIGPLDGHSTVTLTVVPNTRHLALSPAARAQAAVGGEAFTGTLKSHDDLAADCVRRVADDSDKHVEGTIYTNVFGTFWSPLNQAITGTYVSVEPFPLFRYVDEDALRSNTRTAGHGEWLRRAAGRVAGHRLTRRELTGRQSVSPA